MKSSTRLPTVRGGEGGGGNKHDLEVRPSSRGPIHAARGERVGGDGEKKGEEARGEERGAGGGNFLPDDPKSKRNVSNSHFLSNCFFSPLLPPLRRRQREREKKKDDLACGAVCCTISIPAPMTFSPRVVRCFFPDNLVTISSWKKNDWREDQEEAVLFFVLSKKKKWIRRCPRPTPSSSHTIYLLQSRFRSSSHSLADDIMMLPVSFSSKDATFFQVPISLSPLLFPTLQ